MYASVFLGSASRSHLSISLRTQTPPSLPVDVASPSPQVAALVPLHFGPHTHYQTLSLARRQKRFLRRRVVLRGMQRRCGIRVTRSEVLVPWARTESPQHVRAEPVADLAAMQEVQRRW